MIKYIRHIFWISYVLLITSMIHAQDNERRWALSFAASPLIRPVLTTNPSNHSLGRGAGAYAITGEYYLPKKWSVESGYFRTEVSYGGNTRTMEGLHMGIKRYVVNPDFFIQPYLTAATHVNWGRHIEKPYSIHDNYLNAQYTKNPVISFAPGVGTEIYLFSSVALFMKYSFIMGINSKTIIDAQPEPGYAYSLRDKGMYQNLEIGAKITFPFHFSKQDGWALFDIFSNILLSGLARNLDNY